MTYDGADPNTGVHVRVHIDDLDPEHAYLMTRGPGDHTRWSKPLELTVTPT